MPYIKKYTVEENQYLIKLGHKIRETRKSNGMVQQEIAALCESEKASLSRIEAGKTNSKIITLKKIADALKVPLSGLLN